MSVGFVGFGSVFKMHSLSGRTMVPVITVVTWVGLMGNRLKSRGGLEVVAPRCKLFTKTSDSACLGTGLWPLEIGFSIGQRDT